VNAWEHQRRYLASAAVSLADKIEADFVATHGGLAAYLIVQARKEAGDALMGLADVDPKDHDTIQKLQNDVQRHRDLTQWMANAIEDGEIAWRQLDAGEREAIVQTIDPREIEDA
jgi:hypothetical protein